MAFDDHTYRWIVRETLGSSIVKNEKDVLKFVAGYTKYRKMPAAASASSVLSAAALTFNATTALTITSGITNPDVPRNLTMAGSGSGVGGHATVTGLNVEGKTISEVFALNGTSTITGSLAFKNVVSVLVSTQGASGLTLNVGVGNKLGLYHRLEPGQFGMRVVLDTTSAATSLDNQTFDGAATVATSDLVELNTSTPVTVPDGATWFRIYYYIVRWSLNDQDTNEQYSTTTSTSSTSSSTSTSTITTSTSVSSTSTSSTSSSTSSTSSSTSFSSTSTSTTTLP